MFLHFKSLFKYYFILDKINADIGENQRSDHGKTRKGTEMNDRDRIKVVHRVGCGGIEVLNCLLNIFFIFLVKTNDIIHYNNHLSNAQGFITAEEREHSCYIYLYAKKPVEIMIPFLICHIGFKMVVYEVRNCRPVTSREKKKTMQFFDALKNDTSTIFL